MRKILIVYVGLLIVVSLTSVCCAEPLEFGASEPVDHTIEMYHGKKIVHSRKLSAYLEKCINEYTWLHKGTDGVRRNNVKIKRDSVKVIGYYEFDAYATGGYAYCLVRLNNEPENLWWMEVRGLSPKLGDLHLTFHKQDRPFYQDPSTTTYWQIKK